MSDDVSEEARRPFDPEVARVLVENHREFLRFLERRVGRRDLAEDILQDAFARGLDKLATLRDGEAAVPVCRCVARLAETLKPEYADALRRIEVDGVAVKDFAEEQGISPSNAAVRVFRAREALRRQVAASCGTCAEHGCVACTCSKV